MTESENNSLYELAHIHHWYLKKDDLTDTEQSQALQLVQELVNILAVQGKNKFTKYEKKRLWSFWQFTFHLHLKYKSDKFKNLKCKKCHKICQEFQIEGICLECLPKCLNCLQEVKKS